MLIAWLFFIEILFRDRNLFMPFLMLFSLFSLIIYIAGFWEY